MLLESMLSTLIIGKLRGGKIQRIGDIELRGWYLFILGFCIEFMSVFIRAKNIFELAGFLENYFIYIHSFSYLLIFIGLVLNFDRWSMRFVLFGTILNYIVIILNGGKMPVWEKGLQIAGIPEQIQILKDQVVITHQLMTQHTQLAFLGDIIPLAKPYPFAKIVSIGDLFLFFGIFLLLQTQMMGKRGQKKIFSKKSVYKI